MPEPECPRRRLPFIVTELVRPARCAALYAALLMLEKVNSAVMRLAQCRVPAHA